MDMLVIYHFQIIVVPSLKKKNRIGKQVAGTRVPLNSKGMFISRKEHSFGVREICYMSLLVTRCICLSPGLCFFVVFKLDLFVKRDDSLTSFSDVSPYVCSL